MPSMFRSTRGLTEQRCVVQVRLSEVHADLEPAVYCGHDKACIAILGTVRREIPAASRLRQGFPHMR